MSIFSRLFRVAKSEAHSAIDKIEDPIKMTEQGIRDLKKDLDESLKSLAQTKAILIKLRQDTDQKKEVAANYERKAVLLLQKAEKGQLDAGEADRLATEALTKKQEAMTQALELAKSADTQDKSTKQLEANVKRLKDTIHKWENELTTLKARAKVASAQKKLNKQLASVDSSSTVALLEKMKTRVAEDEALAQSYGEIANADKSVDQEIERALGSGGASASASASLAELKAKLKSGNT